MQPLREDVAICARIEVQAFFVLGDIQSQIPAQHVPHHEPGPGGIGCPVIVGH